MSQQKPLTLLRRERSGITDRTRRLFLDTRGETLHLFRIQYLKDPVTETQSAWFVYRSSVHKFTSTTLR